MAYKSKSIISASYSKALNPSGATRDHLDHEERAASEVRQRAKRGSAWRNNASAFDRYNPGGALHNGAYGSSFHYQEAVQDVQDMGVKSRKAEPVQLNAKQRRAQKKALHIRL